MTYQYDPQSDVSVKKYHIPTTPGASTYNDTEWEFTDYISFGASGNRVPRTLVQLASTDGGATWNPTSEEFDYAYDNAGRLIEATFAMSPQTGQTGYSTSYPAGSRGRAFYQYDGGGRLLNLQHYWDVWNPSNSTYTSTAILGNSCVYDPVKNQKVESDFWSADPTTGGWKSTPDRTETYQYDANTDYLTQANYGDGLPNAVQNWTYDAAGNRASDDSNPGTWSYDALNRMTASPGLTYGNDLAGNRTTRSDGMACGWDATNRLTAYSGPNGSWTYGYRPDGLRVSKLGPTSSSSFRYDGDSVLQDDVLTNGVTTATCYALDPRGIDRIEAGGSVCYPIYDGHGNMVATVASVNGQYELGNLRAYDAWGQRRKGTPTGYTVGGYCGTLGHKADDESGFIYMRARSYDPNLGRFLSSDPQLEGSNLYVYCSNNPESLHDRNGKDAVSDMVNALGGLASGFLAMAMIITSLASEPASLALALGFTAAAVAMITVAAVLAGSDVGDEAMYGIVGSGLTIGLFFSAQMMAQLGDEVAAAAIGAKSCANAAVICCFAYCTILTGLLKSEEVGDVVFDMASTGWAA